MVCHIPPHDIDHEIGLALSQKQGNIIQPAVTEKDCIYALKRSEQMSKRTRHVNTISMYQTVSDC